MVEHVLGLPGEADLIDELCCHQFVNGGFDAYRKGVMQRVLAQNADLFEADDRDDDGGAAAADD